MSAKDVRATVIDTGSTNRVGMSVTVDEKGHATINVRGMEQQKIKLDEPVCKQFLNDLRAAAPVENLPRRHCAKSISFGSSLFVEYEGQRSPDLSCPGEEGTPAILRKEANEILRSAREAMGLPANGMPVRPIRRIER